MRVKNRGISALLARPSYDAALRERLKMDRSEAQSTLMEGGIWCLMQKFQALADEAGALGQELGQILRRGELA